MEFIELNENRNTFSIRGQFIDERFSTKKPYSIYSGRAEYDQELHILNNHKKNARTVNSELRKEDPDIAYALEFNHINGHDGRFPCMTQMRDWWRLDEGSSQTWLLTQQLGGTSTLHTDNLDYEKRYLIFCTGWQAGQWWLFDGETYTGWNIGTVIDYDFTRPHATANASEFPRTLMQITHKLK